MFPAECRRLILELVLRDGAMSLRELASTARTSEMTVRRDLRQLEGEGPAARRPGGPAAPWLRRRTGTNRALRAAGVDVFRLSD